MLFFRKKRPIPSNEFLSIEKRFEQFFWETLPPLDGVHIYLLPEEVRMLGLDEGSNFIKVDTRGAEGAGKSVFECVQVGNLISDQLVFKPIKKLEQFINNSDIILRKLI